MFYDKKQKEKNGDHVDDVTRVEVLTNGQDVFEKAVADAKDFKENSFIRSTVNIICKMPAAVTHKRKI